MGNLNNQTWDELWNSTEAETVRAKVRCCDRDCWMIGSVSPAMHKYIWKPATWVLVHKFKALFTKHPYSMYELKICRDYRDGKVTKEDLDKCSTCDMNCVINNGLSEASKEQLKHKTGEEIVDADIAAQQMENIYVMTHTTAPFIKKESIEKGLEAVKSGEYDSSFAAKKLQDFLWKDGKPFNYELNNIPRTQDLPALYEETSGFYIYRSNVMTDLNRRIGDKPFIVEVGEIESVDIDEAEDFMIADAIYNYQLQQK